LALAGLLLPFLVAAVLLDGFKTTILTFHGSDETIFHLPAILRFASQWPVPDLRDYSSATTPLFHLLFSLAGKLLGFELCKLRALNALVSLSAAWVCFRLWRDQLGLKPLSAMLWAQVFLLSPYFFGVSFLLLTDNLAWLFCLCALYLFIEAGRADRLSTWFAGCFFFALTLLTRQTFLWLAPAAVMVAAVQSKSGRAWLVRASGVGLAALCLAPLLWLWHGLVPPSFQEAHEASGLINLRTFEFGLAVIGLYFPLLRSTAFLHALRREALASASAVLAAVILLRIMPMQTGSGDDGLIWRVASVGPVWSGSAWLFWLLMPAGAVSLAHLVHRQWRHLGVLSILFFLVALLPSNLAYQKYFDPMLPFLIMLTRPADRPMSRAESGVAVGLMVVFIAYTLHPYLAAGGGT
jgi:hypothetical protein